jgi:hypothetical protein
MTSSHPNEPLAKSARFSAEGVIFVALADGRVIAARYDVFPRLRKANAKQLRHWRLIGGGVGIHWPDVDEDLSTEGLLRDALLVAPAPATKNAAELLAQARAAQRRR